MLKAKKENEKHSDVNERKEIKSDLDEIKPCAKATGPRVLSSQHPISSENVKNIEISEGMIDVQQLTTSPHERIGNFPVDGTGEQRPQRDIPTREVLNDLCNSRSSDSSAPGAQSDNEAPSLKPFVQSSINQSPTNEDKQREDMSPIIKQEPVSTLDSRLAMYHTNGPAETQSPSSSYGSQPSPGHRTPSPSSPGERNSGNLPSPPELIMHPSGSRHLSPSSSALMNGGTSSFHHSIIPPHSSPLGGYSRHSPNRHSPRAMMSSLHYNDDVRRSPGVTAAAMAASGIGLPTLVPAMSAIPHNAPPPMFNMGENSMLARSGMIDPYAAFSQDRRNDVDLRGPKVSPNAPGGPNPPRGIVGQKEAAAANEGRSGNGGRRGGNNADEKCPYKRPPHTYPALIASAILDSPGNLITLRGIYDYIMNNFPYYKFGHDKSAWQNSIRHNLSLNQCFVKVPRYENAAKSNYWTMTPEGFEEFGNENSFKRRRRRGAALAPISAYKNKKYSGNNADGNASNRAAKQRNNQGENNPLANGVNKGLPPGFMNWGGRSRTPEPSLGYGAPRDSNALSKGLKRSSSPNGRLNGNLGPKHPRMVVLKQGEGPTLEGIRNDHPQRPNSLSSVEEMQGNLNSFSKTLSGGSDGASGAGRSPRHNQGRNSPLSSLNQPTAHQQWIMAAAAAQKNLYAGLLPPGLISTSTTTPPPLVPPTIVSSDGYPIKTHGSVIDAQSKLAGLGVSPSIPVLMDHVEIGSQSPLYLGTGGTVSTWSFACRFCDYKYIDEGSTMLEQHCRLLHQMEITNAKAKAVAAAAVAGNHQEHDGARNLSKSPTEGQDPAGSLMSLQSMVSGFPPMLAAAAGFSNAQNILAAAQAAGISLPCSVAPPGSMSMSNPVTSTPSYFTDPLMRSLAQQMGAGDPSGSTSEALHRSQMAALNSAIQQTTMNASGGSMSQDPQQLRQLIYQQLLMQSPFFSGNPALAAAMPRQIPGARNEISPFAQLWQYQQKVLEMSQNANEKTANDDNEKSESRAKASPSSGSSRKSPNRRTSSSSTSSNHEKDTNDDSEKQLNIHGWKQCQDCDFTAKGAHGLGLHFRKAHAHESGKSENEENGTTPANQRPTSGDHVTESTTQQSRQTERRNSKVLDLSGSKVSDMTSSQEVSDRSNMATQTENEESVTERRSCHHCDVTFGDDTMHALHMSCHDRTDPFKCTICGQECHEKYYFNVHLLRGLHQQNNKKSSREEESEVKLGRRHSNTSERSISSTCSEGRNVTNKDYSRRSPSSVSLPEVTTLPNGDVSMHDASEEMMSHV